MNALLRPEAWGSPLGVGIFLICLGIFIYLLSLADKNKIVSKKNKLQFIRIILFFL